MVTLARIITSNRSIVRSEFSTSQATRSGPTTFNSFFSPLGGGTPCGAGAKSRDPFVFYDQIADRWVITDFAFPSPSLALFMNASVCPRPPIPRAPTSATRCKWIRRIPIGLVITRSSRCGMIRSPAAHTTCRSTCFDLAPCALKASACLRSIAPSMLGGGPTNAVAFTILLAGLGDAYSLRPGGLSHRQSAACREG